MLRAGLVGAPFVTVDDTGARPAHGREPIDQMIRSLSNSSERSARGIVYFHRSQQLAKSPPRTTARAHSDTLLGQIS